MNLPKFVGPINQGSSFVILTNYPSPTGSGSIPPPPNDPNQPTYFLNINDSQQYYWQQLLSDNQLSGIPVFTAVRDKTNGGTTGHQGEYYFLNDVNNRAVALDSNGILSSNSQGVSLRISNNNYQLWDPPTLFLSNVPYGIYSNDGQFVDVIGASGTTGVYAANLVFIPVTWYSQCSADKGQQVSTVAASIGNWACMSNNNQSYCADNHLTPLPNGFTLFSDCNKQLVYSYCPTGDFCGTANCNGMCQAISDDCINDQDKFICKFDPRKYFKDEPWWETTWFKILILVLIIITVLIVIIAIAVETKKKSKQQESKKDNDVNALLAQELKNI